MTTQQQPQTHRLQTLIAAAEAETAQYPQYRGHYANHRLYRVVSMKGLRRRARAQYKVGDVFAGAPYDSRSLGGDLVGVSIHVPGFGDCVVGSENVEEVR